MELMLCCDLIYAADSARIGDAHCNYGIVPGGGGAAGAGAGEAGAPVGGGAAVGGLAAFAAGYSDTVVKAVQGLGQGTAGVPTAHATRGNSLQAEFRIDPITGLLDTQPGQIVSPSSCLGCWTQCGVRVRIDTENNKILRIAGNPYHPLATTQSAPMEQPVREVYAMLGGENGLEGRASACARGASMLEQHSSPYRVLSPLKRVGPRGSGQWERISFEQLIEEVCEGGQGRKGEDQARQTVTSVIAFIQLMTLPGMPRSSPSRPIRNPGTSTR